MSYWNRIYKKYYPIRTDEEARTFVSNESSPLLSILHAIINEQTQELTKSGTEEQRDAFVSEMKQLLFPIIWMQADENRPDSFSSRLKREQETVCYDMNVDVAYCNRLCDTIQRYATNKTMRAADCSRKKVLFFYPICFAWKRNWERVVICGMALGLFAVSAGLVTLFFFGTELANLPVIIFKTGIAVEGLSCLVYVIMRIQKLLHPKRYT